jgi:transcription elongation factor Elf1
MHRRTRKTRKKERNSKQEKKKKYNCPSISYVISGHHTLHPAFTVPNR